ncbi:MAG: hypothetical protein JKX70_03440 [Phycisphaerales bacterium]|nr:hypothetical protein [Phycisphaerales bacterium]
MLQNIIGWIMGNAFLIIIIGGGLFNVAVRLVQKANQQRARRDANHENQRRQQEALRTGRPLASQTQRAPQVDPDAQRKERIEKLRQERMEQLRALREKRATLAAPRAPSTISQNHPNLPPFPIQSQPQQRVRAPQSQPQLRPQQPTLRRSAAPTARQQMRRPTVVAISQPSPTLRKRTPVSRPVPAPSPSLAEMSREERAYELGSDAKIRKSSRREGEAQSARSMLRTPSSIRQAMILKEILDTPIALRDQGIESGSLYT